MTAPVTAPATEAAGERRPDARDWLARELAWSVAFEQGALTDPVIPVGGPERVALRIPEAVVAVVGVGRPPRIEQLLARGPLVVTDRRLLVLGPDDEVVESFDWPADVEVAQADLADGTGVWLVPTEAAREAGVGVRAVLAGSVAGPVPPDREFTAPGVLMWLRVSAAWYASVDRLDEWRVQELAAFGVPPSGA